MDKVLKEAKRLYDLGAAVHWLHPKSKRPVESGWTTGPRLPWPELIKRYKRGLNVGIRLGTPSRMGGKGFLGVIDVDVKSTDEHHTKEVEKELARIFKGRKYPMVKSGRGNGSRHYYVLTKHPLTPFKARQSPTMVKVHMPSVMPSKRELSTLTPEELKAGLRLRNAWEIAVMGEGQQVAAPTSIHPDSGKEYTWAVDFDPALASGFDEKCLGERVHKSVNTAHKDRGAPAVTLGGFEVSPVDLSWLPISDKMRAMILDGSGVEDRSAMLLPIGHALLGAGLTQNEALTVLTDPETFIGLAGYEHAKTNDRARAAAWVWRYSLAKVVADRNAENIFSEPIEDATPSKATAEQSMDDFDSMHDWRRELEVTKDDNIKGTLCNVITILENVAGADFIKRDLFAYRDFYHKPTPWGGVKDDAINDDDVKEVKAWLGREFGIEPRNNILSEALTLIARKNSFDPVVDGLRALAPWDGVERLDTWLKKNFEAEGDEEYLAQVFRKWMVAMVIRTFEPGAKFDWMPIFEGAQGIGKSSFGRILCGDKFFLDWLPDLMNKDSALALQGIWAVEMGELASFRKNEIEAVKAFITRTVDKVRPPYGERWVESRRRCVFFGTTNFDTYLRDESGNRRFKPVKVGQLNFDALRAEREQLFAEALWLYESGFETVLTLELDEKAKPFERKMQAEKMVEDEAEIMENMLYDFWAAEQLKPAPERFDFLRFKLHQILGEGSIGPLRKFKLDNRNTQFLAKALKKLGAKKRGIRGRIYWKWGGEEAEKGSGR